MATRGADGCKFKKKKKDNFLRQAKRHAKRGNFGLGKRLSEEEYNYYMRVFEQLKHVDGEEKEILVRNFFYELEREGQVKSLASNQVISRILDDALPLADIKQVQALSQVFATDLRPTCIDPYASHVLQTLLTLSLKYGQRGAVQKRCEENDEGETKEIIIEVTDEQREEFNTFMNKVGRFVYNNLEDFVCNTYASHVIRTVLEICSGVELQDSVKSSHRAQTTHALQKEVGKFITVPSKLKELLHDIAVRFTKLPNLSEIIQYDCGSAVLQSLLMVLRDVEEEQCQTLVTHILQHGLTGVSAYYDDGSNYEGVPVGLPTLFQDKPASRLLEVMIMSSTAEQQKEIFQQYFKGNMKTLVQHHSANFAVQKLLSSWKEKDTFGELFEEVCEALEAATEAQHMGVVHALSQACRRLSASQSRCMQALMQLLGCWEPERLQVQFAPMLLRMMPYKEYQAKHSEGNLPPISLQGALTLQELLHFHKPIKVVNSLLDMSVADLQVMACDPRGSHVVDAFVLSTFLGAKNREKFLNRFKGTCTSLACSKHGSRSLEALWKVASTKIKTQICSELVVDELKLKGSPFGIIIYTNFQVHMFRRGDKSDWQELIDKAEKKRKLFDDLLVESGGEQKKKKHKKKEVT
ncbi:nucleolar protein 9-like [Homarus americanus]|uniref:Nucleolar protein 9-like n=1 Tax=Homarus americanus TaxID=6706 RepID=A0A8J5MPD6_HOMAM|nr:nucleolar protein 9-like [Homarus americanus]KAG7158750.1 Nucleolar protein 9-like [Homarus americanus]